MNVANMHSIAIFLGFLIGTYGLAWWLGLAVLFWQSRNDARDDAVNHDVNHDGNHHRPSGRG